MVRIDENHEAIARIRMAIENDKKAQVLEGQANLDSDSVEMDSSSMSQNSEMHCRVAHWTFGSPSGGQQESRELEKTISPTDSDYISFNDHLRSFITQWFPEDAPRYEDLIYVCSSQTNSIFILLTKLQVQSFKCVMVTYQSMEDWTEARDILHCNPSFHQRKQYDCLIINDDTPGTTVVRLHSLLRCRLLSGKLVDIALVHTFKRTKWRPYTLWDNCQIYEEVKEPSFVLMDYVVRGVVLCPAFNTNSNSLVTKLHYIVDTVDADMFLRVNSW